MNCVGEIPSSSSYLRVTFAKEEMETGAQNRKEGRKEGRGRRKKEVGTTNLRPVGLLSVRLCRSSCVERVEIRTVYGICVYAVIYETTHGKSRGKQLSCVSAFSINAFTITRKDPHGVCYAKEVCAWSPAERLHAFLLVNRKTGLCSR